jgi:hypothetical protein
LPSRGSVSGSSALEQLLDFALELFSEFGELELSSHAAKRTAHAVNAKNNFFTIESPFYF